MWKTLRIGALDINGNSHDAMMMMMMTLLTIAVICHACAVLSDDEMRGLARYLSQIHIQDYCPKRLLKIYTKLLVAVFKRSFTAV